MSFLVWDQAPMNDAQSPGVGLASSRRVFRAAEVPLLRDAASVIRTIESRAQEQVQRLDAAVAAAQREGHAEGLAQGVRDGQAEVAQHLVALARDAHAERERLRGQVASLALAAARKMLGDIPAAERLAAAAAQAARHVLPDERMTLHVHPSRVADIKKIVIRDDGALAWPAATEVVADSTLTPEDCRLETVHGSAEVGLDTQLSRLALAWGVQASEP